MSPFDPTARHERRNLCDAQPHTLANDMLEDGLQAGAGCKRREFIGLVGGAVVWPISVGAQQPAIPVVGILYSAPIDGLRDETSAFRAGLAEIGYIDGQNVSFDYRTADNHLDRLHA